MSVDKLQRRAARAEQERRAWRLRQQGNTYQEIADELGLAVHVVRAMAIRQEAEVKERFLQDASSVKADHLGKLELLYAESLQAYYRSCDDAVEVTTGMAALNQRTGEVVELPDKEVRRGQSGNVQYLLAAGKFLEDQRKIAGANTPDKVEVDFSEDTAMASLKKKLDDLAQRQVAENNKTVEIPALDESTPRNQLQEALDVIRQRRLVAKIETIPASVRAETATAGYDLEGGGGINDDFES